MIDITQEIFSGCVYPGDTKPTFRRASSLEAGDACTLTDFSMCAHNGTHLDAPAHFIRGGKTIEQMDLTRCAGRCAVRDFAGEVKESDVADIAAERLLLRGACSLTAGAARLLAGRCRLVGVEGQSVGDEQVHRILLGAEVAVLEGLVLRDALPGEYILIALPIKLGGSDGAPVRALLGKEGEVLV